MQAPRTAVLVAAVLAGALVQLAGAFLLPAAPPLHVHYRASAFPPSGRMPRPATRVVAPTPTPSSLLRLQAEGDEGKSSGGEAASGSSDKGTAERRKIGRRKRVRKDRPASSATEASAPLDPRLREAQEDIMRREFDRELVLEEFAAPRTVDRTRKVLTPIPPPAAPVADREAGGEEDTEGSENDDDDDDDNAAAGNDEERRMAAAGASVSASQGPPQEESGVPANLRYDPTFEIPIPSETVISLSDIATKFDGAIETEQKALPTLAELGKKAKGSILRRQLEEVEKASKELEPIDDYDLSSGILGEGRPVFGIGLPYLQSCHTVIILVTLLCAFVEFPGFPLTNLPYEMRDFLKGGLVVVYLINAVLAYDSIKEAKKRDQSVFFWALKCFVLGALAHNELLLIREKPQASI